MLLAEVEPKSRTHKDSSEFSRREISAIPLERRVRFCGTAGAEAWSEEPRKNLITLSATDGMYDYTRASYAHHLRGRSLARFSLNINLALEGGAVLNRNTVRRNITVYHRRLPQLDSLRSADGAIYLALDHNALGIHGGLDSSIRPDDQAVVAKLNAAFNVPIHVQVFGARQLSFNNY